MKEWTHVVEPRDRDVVGHGRLGLGRGHVLEPVEAGTHIGSDSESDLTNRKVRTALLRVGVVERFHNIDERVARGRLGVVVDPDQVDGRVVVGVELLVLGERGDVRGEEHLDFGSNVAARFCDDVPSLLEVIDGSLVGTVGLVVVDLVRESEPDFDAHVGVLLHDLADRDGLLVVVVRESPPSSDRHHGGCATSEFASQYRARGIQREESTHVGRHQP